MLFKSNPTRRKVLRAATVSLESLENRCLMHGGPGGIFGGPHPGPGGPGLGGGPLGGPGGGFSASLNVIEFSETPTAVQSGLSSLATADALSAPTATQDVVLGNYDGIETYSITINGTGTVSRLTVDATGNPVTAPTHTSSTWEILNGSGAGSNAAAAAEISSIVAALSLTAPTATTAVDVTTTADGAVTYAMNLDPSAEGRPVCIQVDANGNPVGNAALPFSVIPASIQAALNAGAPTGATALDATSTETVHLREVDGVQVYSVAFTVSGTTTKVNVGMDGNAVTLPASTTEDFSAAPDAVKTELQTLASAHGVTGTISDTQIVKVLTEANGLGLYSVTLSALVTNPSGHSVTRDLTITVDANGNPTTLPGGPENHGPMGRGGGGGPESHDHPEHGAPDDSTGTGTSAGTGAESSSGNGNCDQSGSPTTTGSTGSTDSGSSGSTSLTPGTGSGESTASDRTTISGAALDKAAKGVSISTRGIVDPLGGSLVSKIASTSVSTSVQADLDQIKTDRAALKAAIKALSATDRATLNSDMKAIRDAIKAIKSTIDPLKAQLKADSKTWRATLKADRKAIRAAGTDQAAIDAAKAQLATDQAAATAALVADQKAIQAAIDSDAGVIAARAQLASDLPAIASAIDTLQADYAKLQDDLLA